MTIERMIDPRWLIRFAEESQRLYDQDTEWSTGYREAMQTIRVYAAAHLKEKRTLREIEQGAA